ncbi:epimerase [Pseudooceanicola lipolyticus]|uniref:Epimerase n=1 Tax=Pseudooceanicola lipolyticus TaxID=2029104 RepID=A0A2M8J0R4_9RHOB|nr:epimerase [Pseudooceanicola lipolyticus]PJE36361.1 epimerase [Pseudooceanicola lipolyticus]
MTQTVLILGASGRFGRHAATAFDAAGWVVRRFDRRTGDLAAAARGAQVIVNAWNPPYPDWARQVPVLTQQVIGAARQSGATVMIPGNVYMFGEQTPPPWGAGTPHAARNPMGRIRIEMEAAYASAGLRTIVLRAGDFIDTQASGNWFDLVLTKRLAKGVFSYPGDPAIPHAWAYLPDMARAAVQLVGMRADLPAFADIPFPGYTLTGHEMAAALGRVTRGEVQLRRMSMLPLRLAAPVWPLGRRLLEMSYLWRRPHWLDGTRFDDLLPEFRATPVETALASALPAGLVKPQVYPDQAVAAGG